MSEEYLTPEQVEAVKAASDADTKLYRELVKRRYQRAVDYLDDKQWQINSPFIWKRSYDGQKLMYLVDKDRYHLTDPFRHPKPGDWGSEAFKLLFMIAHETADGFGENEIDRLQKTRTPRKGRDAFSPRETLYIPKLNTKSLAAHEKVWNENEVPPLEVLQQMVKWDTYLQVLVKINLDRDTTEYVLQSNFVELNGEMYAVWRIRSMLEFGNQDGYVKRNHWKELLEKHPKSTTPLLPPVEVVPTPKLQYKIHGIKRLRAHTTKQAALVEQQQKEERAKLALQAEKKRQYARKRYYQQKGELNE